MRVKLIGNKQNEFLKKVLTNIPQKELAKQLGVSRSCIRKWLRSDRLLPDHVFKRLCDDYKLQEYRKYVLERLEDNWGQVTGGREKIKNVKDINKLMEVVRKSRISSKVIHIKKVNTKTKFGLDVKKMNLDPTPLIIVMLLTDGCVHIKKTCAEIVFISKSNELIDIFLELVRMKYDDVKISLYENKKSIKKVYFFLPLRNELVTIIQSYKKSPCGEGITNYLKKSQPTLNFLMNLNEIYKVLSLRLAFTTEGCITMAKYNRRSELVIKPKLIIACSHPKLCMGWKKILEQFGLKFSVMKDNSKWSGISGLCSENQKNIHKFYKMGGFIRNVKITGKSKYFKGIEKNKLLEVFVRRKKFKSINEINKVLMDP